MKEKTCLALILLLGSAVNIVPGLSKTRASACCASPAVETAEAKKVAVYYFHNTVRCPTCLRMEEYSEIALQAAFSDELKSGKIEWRPVDMQAPENKHFAEEFRLRMSSLVIVRFRDGKQVEWRNLDKIWDHVGDMTEFVKYVQDNVKSFLEAK